MASNNSALRYLIDSYLEWSARYFQVDAAGRVFCTGPGGTWVFAPDGTNLGIIRTPEVPANFAFGGPDLRTLFFTARTSVYTLRVRTPGQPHPWYRVRSR